jgi:hypothetical protein
MSIELSCSLYFHRWKSHCSLSLLLLLSIRFLWFRLRTLGLGDRSGRFLLYWLVRLVSRFLLRNGLLRIAMSWVAIFLICHFACPLLVFLLLVSCCNRVNCDSGA